MSRNTASGEFRVLPLLHSAGVLGLAVAWAYYCWRESMLRVAASRAGRDTVLGLHHALGLLQASLGDLLLGFSVLLLFAVGTGIYVRRIQVWMDARSSGDAVAYGGADLKDQALAANITQEPRS